MINKQHTLWTEKYRPVLIDDYICSDILRAQLGKFVESKDIPHLILYGNPGGGKTSLGKLLAKNINCDYIYINCSDENGIATVREKIKNFVSAASFKPLKIVIADEADFFSAEAQAALRGVVEEFSLNSRFIFTCNSIDKLIDPIKSRCDKYSIGPNSKKAVALRLSEILEAENVTYEPKDLKVIIDRKYPDIRQCVSTMQSCVTKENKLDVKLFYSGNTSYLCDILNIMKSPGKESWTKIRQLIVDADLTDYTEVFRYLYQNAEEFSGDKYEDVVIVISDCMYKQYFVPDREINAAEMFLKILQIIKK